MVDYGPPPPAPEAVPEPPRKQRTCFFCCLGLVIALAIVGVAFAAMAVFLWQSMTQAIQEVASETPMDIPAASLPEPGQEELYARLADFHQAVKGGEGARELTLSQQELNYLLQHEPPFNQLGRFYATLQDGALEVQASLSFDQMPGASLLGLEGHYLNGTATLSVDTDGPRPEIYITSFSRPEGDISEQTMQQLRTINLADMLAQNPAVQNAMGAVKTIEIRENALRLSLSEGGGGATQ